MESGPPPPNLLPFGFTGVASLTVAPARQRNSGFSTLHRRRVPNRRIIALFILEFLIVQADILFSELFKNAYQDR